MAVTARPSAPADQGAPIRVLVADDHALFRRGLRAALDDEPDLLVVGEAADGVAAVESALVLRPDVVLMDVRMPRRSGVAATADIRVAVPATRVLVLSVSDDESDLFDALRAGACGYLLKGDAGADLAAAVRIAHAGGAPLTPAMAAPLLTEFVALSGRAEAEQTGPVLTARELEVLRLVARGMSNREVGAAMTISENTVRNHMHHLLAKLGVRSRTDAVLHAVRAGLIGL